MTIQPGTTLEFKNYTLLGYPIPEITYQWYRNDTPIEGANFSTYELTNEDSLQGISLSVNVSNIFNEITYFYALGATVFPGSDQVPSFLTTPIAVTQLNPYPGLTSTVGSYGSTGTSPITTTFTWVSGGTTVGTNSESYLILNSDQENTLNCVIELENIYGITSSTVDFGIVGSFPSFIITPNGVGIPPYIGITSSVENYGSTGTTPITTTFTWLSDGITVGTNTDSYLIQDTDYSKEIICRILIENSIGSTYEDINFGYAQENWDYDLDGIYELPTPFNENYNDVVTIQSGVTLTNLLSASTLEGSDEFRLKFDSAIQGPIYASVWDGITWSTYQSWSSLSTEQRFNNLQGFDDSPPAGSVLVLYENNPGNPSVWVPYT